MFTNLPVLALSAFLLFAAFVNLNDPDAWLWSTAYGISAVLCALSCSTKFSSSVQRAFPPMCLFSLGLSVYSFVQLDTMKMSGVSGIFGIFELEPIREGGGALIMFLALLMSMSFTPSKKSLSNNNVFNSMFSIAAVIVACTGIGLGLYLPGYYNKLGVNIPEHCGGEVY